MTGRRPGAWPVPKSAAAAVAEPDDGDVQGEQHLTVVAGQARFHLTLGAVRADLEEQPSDRSVRSAAKRWHDAITALTEEVLAERRRGG